MAQRLDELGAAHAAAAAEAARLGDEGARLRADLASAAARAATAQRALAELDRERDQTALEVRGALQVLSFLSQHLVFFLRQPRCVLSLPPFPTCTNATSQADAAQEEAAEAEVSAARARDEASQASARAVVLEQEVGRGPRQDLLARARLSGSLLRVALRPQVSQLQAALAARDKELAATRGSGERASGEAGQLRT